MKLCFLWRGLLAVTCMSGLFGGLGRAWADLPAGWSDGDGVRIGRGVTVGANAVVTSDVPAGAAMVGTNRILSNRSPYALD